MRRYISVALSLGSPPAAVSSYPCPVELGLSSSAVSRVRCRLACSQQYSIIIFAAGQYLLLWPVQQLPKKPLSKIRSERTKSFEKRNLSLLHFLSAEVLYLNFKQLYAAPG